MLKVTQEVAESGFEPRQLVFTARPDPHEVMPPHTPVKLGVLVNHFHGPGFAFPHFWDFVQISPFLKGFYSLSTSRNSARPPGSFLCSLQVKANLFIFFVSGLFVARIWHHVWPCDGGHVLGWREQNLWNQTGLSSNPSFVVKGQISSVR